MPVCGRKVLSHCPDASFEIAQTVTRGRACEGDREKSGQAAQAKHLLTVKAT